jgi:antitoxin VapB
MSINVKNREAEDLLAEIKTATGRGTTEILLDLLRREAVEQRRRREIDRRWRRIAQLSRRYSARLPDRPATPDEIIGYDEDGLPR